ncbi:MAG: bis(5'-nucleosyl)-tetraphosphatase (symmetrical) YqeK [Coriobacteriia bacterium]|nr:bis(5'-nucleosyl)-tetraphosphatase (symmetrical) YqeK [Coriobacteriia bacterium]
MAKDASEKQAKFYAKARKELEKRLTNYRFIHSVSVADTAAAMAKVYGVDVEEARIAGLLHDWDKNHSDKELTERARKFGVTISAFEDDMVALLHAQTGACALAEEFSELSPKVIQAVARHTSAAADMTDLDMVVYIADMIEPLRTRGNLATLRELVGKISLEELFVKSYEITMKHLVTRHRFIHPDSLDVWNAYIQRERLNNEQAGSKQSISEQAGSEQEKDQRKNDNNDRARKG